MPSHDTITAARAALRAGTTTAADLVEHAAANIAAANHRVNAFISLDLDRARADAIRCDRERAAGLDRGSLHGIPLSIKDLFDEQGTVTTAASRVLLDRVASGTSTIVTRLRAAGAIILGRTNLHEFALGPTSEDSAFGPVRHPWDETRVAGGSSGGSAAAVALGMGLGSIGTDTGGSIRIPAAICGVVGLKPSPGELSTEGVIPLSASLDTVGPIARTVEDAALLYEALSERPSAPVVPPSRSTLKLRRLRGYFDVLDSEVRERFEAALVRLREAGVSIGEGEVAGSDRISAAYTNIVLPEAARWHEPYLETRADAYQPPVRSRISDGRSIPAADYEAALWARREFRRAVNAALQDHDALILPAVAVTAPLIGQAELTVGSARLPVRAAMLRQTQLFNLSGHPAISVPIRGHGLPVGCQLVGGMDETGRLLAIAAACEALL